jgi:hypothetical protein
MFKELPKENYFDKLVFEQPVYDCEEDASVFEDILLQTKNFKSTDDTHADENPYGLKYLNDKKNYNVNSDFKIRKKPILKG